MTLLTEQEAREKWCPFARYSGSGFDCPSANRWKQAAPESEPHALNPIPCRCIASQCMAWRTGETAEFKRAADHEYQQSGKRLTSDTGFCGLAGRPE